MTLKELEKQLLASSQPSSGMSLIFTLRGLIENLAEFYGLQSVSGMLP
jgi:hypothetical protein